MEFKRNKNGIYIHSSKHFLKYSIIVAINLLIWLFFLQAFKESEFSSVVTVFRFISLLTLSVMLPLWLMLWGWYHIWYRYIVFFIVWILSKVLRILKNTFVQIMLLVILVILVQHFLNGIKGKNNINSELSKIDRIIFTISLTVFLFLLLELFKKRKQVLVLEFIGYTNDENLKILTKGIASRISSEVYRISKLLRTIDDIQPEPFFKPRKYQDFIHIESTMDIQDIAKSLENVISSQPTLEVVPFFKIQITSLHNLFARLVRRIVLSGCLHIDGEKLTLMTRIRGRGTHACITVDSDEIENHSTLSQAEKIEKMTEQMVCRIFVEFGEENSLRWEAIKFYTEGLRLFRNTTHTMESRLQKLLKAKNAFISSLKIDNRFAECYYNLGIIYRCINVLDVAEISFKRALALEPNNFSFCHTLAYHYYKDKRFKKADWLCQKASLLCPENADNWNLLGIIQYKRWIEENQIEDDGTQKIPVPDSISFHFKNATMLSWKALCKSVLTGNKVQAYQNVAKICIRNLAKILGIKGTMISGPLFNQSLFLEPGDNDLNFELGRYYFRVGNWKKAYSAFYHVFDEDEEIKDVTTFWALFSNACAKMYAITEKECYKQIVIDNYVNFLNAIGGVIQECLDNIAKLGGADGVMQEIEKKIPIRCTKLMEEALDEIGELEEKERLSRIKKFIELLIEIQMSFIPIKLVGENLYIPPNVGDNEINLRDWDWAIYQIKLTASKALWNQGRRKNSMGRSWLTDAISYLYANHISEIVNLGMYDLLVKWLLEGGEFKTALAYAREAVELNPTGPRELQTLGDVWVALKEYKQGVRKWRSSFDLTKPDTHALKSLGRAFIKKATDSNDYADRTRIINSAINLFSNSLEIMQSFPTKGGEDEVKSKYITECGEVHYYLAIFYRELLNYNDAVSHFQIALSYNYRKLRTLMKMGKTFIEMKLFKRAEESFCDGYLYVRKLKTEDRKAWKIKRYTAELFIHYTQAIIERNITIRNEESSDFKKANRFLDFCFKQIQYKKYNLEKRDKNWLLSLYYQCWGRVEHKLGNFIDSISFYEESIAHTPLYSTYFYLAEAFWELAKKTHSNQKKKFLKNCRSACLLCQKNDIRNRFQKETTEILHKIDSCQM